MVLFEEVSDGCLVVRADLESILENGRYHATNLGTHLFLGDGCTMQYLLETRS